MPPLTISHSQLPACGDCRVVLSNYLGVAAVVSLFDSLWDYGLLELAQAGHEVIIQDAQKGKARLMPIATTSLSGPRRFGLHQGEVWMGDDFNAPLPDSFWLNEKAG